MDANLTIVAAATLYTPRGEVAPGTPVEIAEDEGRSLVTAGLARVVDPSQPAAAEAGSEGQDKAAGADGAPAPHDSDDEGAVVAQAAGVDPAKAAADAAAKPARQGKKAEAAKPQGGAKP